MQLPLVYGQHSDGFRHKAQVPLIFERRDYLCVAVMEFRLKTQVPADLAQQDDENFLFVFIQR